MNIKHKGLLVVLLGLPSFNSFAQVDFDREVRPILSNHCFACHGPDEKKRKAKLRLDLKEGLFGERETVLVTAGKPEASELFLRVSHDDPEERMPPQKFPKPLKPSQVKTIKDWITQGAKWEDHWAYVTPKRPSLPEGANAISPIDQFILARLKETNLSP
ncbi:uncharacterized protein METZ01_LOCUS96756, partial [marine metagenome]